MLGLRSLTPLLLVAAMAGSSCRYVERPRTPLPADFRVENLATGEILTREFFAGKPWVIHVFVPL